VLDCSRLLVFYFAKLHARKLLFVLADFKAEKNSQDKIDNNNKKKVQCTRVTT